MFKVTVNDQNIYHINNENEEWYIGKAHANVDVSKIDEGLYHVLLNGKSFRVRVPASSRGEKEGGIFVNGNFYGISVSDKYDQLLRDLGIEQLGSKMAEPVKSPMPGLVLKIPVKAGDTVKEGETVIILEAMKMENVIKAPAEAVVKAVRVNTGDSVEKGHVLIEFE